MKFEFLDFDVETPVLLPPPLLLRHLLRLHHRRRPRLPPPRQPHPPVGNDQFLFAKSLNHLRRKQLIILSLVNVINRFM